MAGVAEWAGRMPDPHRLDPRTKSVARSGRLLGGALLAYAKLWDAHLARNVSRIFRKADVVLTPTTAKPPLPIGSIDGLSERETDQVIVKACPMCWPWNVLGWPGLSVPAGLTGDGLPLGAQLLGSPNSEGLLLALGRQLEQAERWHERRPPISAP
jgi:amidase